MKHGWEYKKLGEVCKITCGFTPKSDELSNEGYFPYFKVADMNTIGNEVFLSATQSYLKKSNKYYSKDSIVFPKNGATIATNKKRILKQDSIVDLNTAVASFDNEIIETMFSYYWFMNVDFKDYMRGGALPTLDIKTLKSSIIPIPPLSIQQSIVSELDEINNLLSLKRKELETYDKLAQSLFYEMFGDPVENEMGWEVKNVIDVVTFQRGYDLPTHSRVKEGNIPVYGSNGILDYHNESKIDKGIITGRSGTIGKVYISETPCWPLNTTLFSKETHGNNLIYLSYLLSFFDLNRFVEGAGVPTLNRNNFHNKSIISPPLPLQQLFAQRIEAIEEQKVHVKAAIEKLETLLAARMQYWFE